MKAQLKHTLFFLTALSFIVLAAPSLAGEQKSGAMRDAWLEGKLDTVILLNEHLNPFEIESEVQDGVATISGTVDSEVEINLTTELAKGIEGITDVENNLQVEPATTEAGRDNRKNDAGSNINDAAITTAISTKLLMNTEINSLDIDVDTDSGVVKLNGSVENEAERDLVEQLAKNTFDVKEVQNRLQVKATKS